MTWKWCFDRLGSLASFCSLWVNGCYGEVTMLLTNNNNNNNMVTWSVIIGDNHLLFSCIFFSSFALILVCLSLI